MHRFADVDEIDDNRTSMEENIQSFLFFVLSEQCGLFHGYTIKNHSIAY